jgi:probable phosphoglycerate mutase
MSEIYLIRHGETTLSRGGQYIGSSDVPLSDHGRRQAQRLADRLRSTQFDAGYCSPMDRCRETARIVAAAHQLTLTAVADLREIDYGAWERLTREEMRASTPDLYAAWLRDPAAVRAPGGESGEDVLRRARPALHALAARHPGQRVLVVAHRTVNRLLLCDILGYPLARYRQAVGQDLTALNIFEYANGSFAVTLVNDTEHLKLLMTPRS